MLGDGGCLEEDGYFTRDVAWKSISHPGSCLSTSCLPYWEQLSTTKTAAIPVCLGANHGLKRELKYSSPPSGCGVRCCVSVMRR